MRRECEKERGIVGTFSFGMIIFVVLTYDPQYSFG